MARWFAISGLLVFTAFDEAASIHELFDRVEARHAADGIFYYAWVVPYGVLVGAVAVCFFISGGGCLCVRAPDWRLQPPFIARAP